MGAAYEQLSVGAAYEHQFYTLSRERERGGGEKDRGGGKRKREGGERKREVEGRERERGERKRERGEKERGGGRERERWISMYIHEQLRGI